MGPKSKPSSATGAKKKASSAGKKGAAAALSPGEQETAFKLAKADVGLEVLQRELDFTQDVAHRLKAKNSEHRGEIAQLNRELAIKSQDRIDVTSDMARQYRQMQAEMGARIQSLEAQVEDLKTRLGAAQAAAQEAAREHQRVVREKDEIIEEQEVKMSYMSSEFENMLSETLAKMSRKLEAVSQRWKESDTMHLSESSSRRLADFQMGRLAAREKQ